MTDGPENASHAARKNTQLLTTVKPTANARRDAEYGQIDDEKAMNPKKLNLNRSFKFSLTNLLALIAVVAVSAAWLADRKRLELQADAAEKRSLEFLALADQAPGGWGIASSAIETNEISSDFVLSPTIDDFRSLLELRLLSLVERLYKRKSGVDESSDIAEFSAPNLAGQTLFLLGWGCDTPEEFVDKSVVYYNRSGIPLKPYHHIGSESYKKYLEFLSESLQASIEYGHELDEVNMRYAIVENLELGIQGPEKTSRQKKDAAH